MNTQPPIRSLAQSLDHLSVFECIEIDVSSSKMSDVVALRLAHGLSANDAHDQRSHQFLVLANGMAVGCARLTAPDGKGLLPLQHEGQEHFASSGHVAAVLSNPRQCLELSAAVFTPSKDSPLGVFNDDDGRDDHGLSSVSDRRVASRQILTLLCQSMFSRSLLMGVRYWVAALPPVAAHALNQMGFYFRKAGPDMSHFGDVAPYITDLGKVQEIMSTLRPDLLAWLRGESVDPRKASQIKKSIQATRS